MENEIQAEPVAVETTAPVEASTKSGSTDKIRATMEASYDRASDRMPSEAELTRYSNPELPIADETTEQPEVTDNGDTPDYPPQSWKAEMHPLWFQLPAEAKAYVAQRELEMQRGLSKYAELAADASKVTERLDSSVKETMELGSVIERFNRHIPRLPDGNVMPTPQILNHLLTANQILNENPEQALRYLARSHGVDLAKLAETPIDPVEQFSGKLASRSRRQDTRNVLRSKLSCRSSISINRRKSNAT